MLENCSKTPPDVFSGPEGIDKSRTAINPTKHENLSDAAGLHGTSSAAG